MTDAPPPPAERAAAAPDAPPEDSRSLAAVASRVAGFEANSSAPPPSRRRPDVARAAALLEAAERPLLLIGDVDRLVAEATAVRLWEAGNAGGELLDWIAMLGALEPRPPAFLEAQMQFGHAFAAWA